MALEGGGQIKLCQPCTQAATRCAEENMSEKKCAELLPRLVRAHGSAGRAVAHACGNHLGPKLLEQRVHILLELLGQPDVVGDLLRILQSHGLGN